MEEKKASDVRNDQNKQKLYKIFHRRNHFSHFEIMREKNQLCDVNIKVSNSIYIYLDCWFHSQ